MAEDITTLIQAKILWIFKEYKRICEKYNLRYFAIGGTCLGAVRHKGFIPWDDDLDVIMPYEDYCKFIKISMVELKSEYQVIGPHNCEHYDVSWIKLHDINTTFIEKFSINYKDRYSGVFIDIFPVFGLPSDLKLRRKLYRYYEIYRHQNKRKRYPLLEAKSIKAKLLWYYTHITSGSESFHYFTDLQEDLFKPYAFDESDEILFGWRDIKNAGWYKRVFPLDDFISKVEVPFEDTTISIPIGYDNYLTMEFGDYMQLPPENERNSIHNLELIDLERPFKYYQDREYAI